MWQLKAAILETKVNIIFKHSLRVKTWNVTIFNAKNNKEMLINLLSNGFYLL